MVTNMHKLAHESVEQLKEQIHAAVVGKAYIAVLKDRLHNASSSRSCKAVFDEAYNAALKLAACDPMDTSARQRAR